MSVIDAFAKNGGDLESLESAASAVLFEKAAAAEGIDLETLSEEQVNALYTHFTTGGETQEVPAEEVKEAEAKLAEATIIGQHMARAFVDEVIVLNKEAASDDKKPPFLKGKKGEKGEDNKDGEKKAAFETLAIERANKMLKNAGIDPDAAVESDNGVTLEDMVNARAVEMLEAAGYEFEE